MNVPNGAIALDYLGVEFGVRNHDPNTEGSVYPDPSVFGSWCLTPNSTPR